LFFRVGVNPGAVAAEDMGAAKEVLRASVNEGTCAVAQLGESLLSVRLRTAICDSLALIEARYG